MPSIVRSKSSRRFFNYKISNQELEKVDFMKDLRIIYQSNFEFDMHLNTVTWKAFKMLGFLKRSTKEFSSGKSLIYLYKTTVRPILLFGSIIWSSSKITLISKLESVQHKFLRYFVYKTSTPLRFDEHDYTDIALSCNLISIRSLQIYYDSFFVKKVALNMIMY